jgi:hypothetical protein
MLLNITQQLDSPLRSTAHWDHLWE